MPNYLDEKCIDFLFSIAHKEYAIQVIRNELEDIKIKLKNKLNNKKNNFSKSKGMLPTFKTEFNV